MTITNNKTALKKEVIELVYSDKLIDFFLTLTSVSALATPTHCCCCGYTGTVAGQRDRETDRLAARRSG